MIRTYQKPFATQKDRKRPLVFNVVREDDIWSVYCHCDNPLAENKERTQLFADEWGSKGKHSRSKSIHCYQDKALNGHKRRENHDACDQRAQGLAERGVLVQVSKMRRSHCY